MSEHTDKRTPFYIEIKAAENLFGLLCLFSIMIADADIFHTDNVIQLIDRFLSRLPFLRTVIPFPFL